MKVYTFLQSFYGLLPIAAEEYEESFKWDEEKSVVAADGFIFAVQDAINAACSNPDRYRNTYKNLREITLKKRNPKVKYGKRKRKD